VFFFRLFGSARDAGALAKPLGRAARARDERDVAPRPLRYDAAISKLTRTWDSAHSYVT
jgi:hypothetical protein